jgi:hypothetical protein
MSEFHAVEIRTHPLHRRMLLLDGQPLIRHVKDVSVSVDHEGAPEVTVTFFAQDITFTRDTDGIDTPRSTTH